MAKIVIAEDNKDICHLISCLLVDEGHEVDLVHDGYELIAYLKDSVPEVIVLDLVMPGKDGLSVFDSVKGIAPQARIIIYTGREEYRNSVYARTADKFVLKGGDMKDIVKAIEELVG